MQEPDLNKMWRTWIKIGIEDNARSKRCQDAIRQKMQPILQLQKDGEIAWFYFLLHNKFDDPSANLYFDVVFTTDRKEPNEILPEYCFDTVKIPPMNSISGIDEKIFDGEDIKKAWRIIGEQSEFIIKLVCSHKENIEIPPKQIAQFMHFFMNMLGYGNKSLFFPKSQDVNWLSISSPLVDMTKILGGEYWQF